MRIGYLDCFSGAAGDMWVGALLDLGVELSALRAAVASLQLPGVEVSARRVHRAGLAACRFEVAVAPHTARAHRHLDQIRAIVGRADVPEAVRANATAVFEALADVESRAHDVPREEVHFHEVGADDTIVDVLCACHGLHLLGVQRLYASAVAVGSGTVRCEHGTLPVPAPGALGNLLGVPVRSGGPAGERVTPTGAALLRVLVDEFEPQLTWIPQAAGLGAGHRDDSDRPNVLRLTLGRLPAGAGAGHLFEVTCNLDTATGELLGYLLQAALDAGAVDAFATPVLMKKGRPGYQLTALVDDASRDGVVRLLLEESTSLGVRMHAAERQVLERWAETRDTDLGAVRGKAWRLPSGVVAWRPEDDEVARLAREHRLGRNAVLARLASAPPPPVP